jgi:sulfate permease, SulP family
LQAAEADGIKTVVLDAETIPFIDVTAARMLATLADTLHRQSVDLLLARSIGQVRDVLRSVIDESDITPFYPTLQACRRLAPAPHLGSRRGVSFSALRF